MTYYTRLVSLERIQANPWQPRESDDPEHIKALALDIAANGLLQTPVGRIVDGLHHPIGEIADMADGEWSVQLAFGHSRLAAYRWLNDMQTEHDDDGDWHVMPVIIQPLSDEQMFAMAVSENLQRRDLTVIEVAKSMARYRSEFGKTSSEIGQLFGMSDSAVRNKIRLLELPEDVQKGLAENGASERAARELLALFDLPEDIRKLAEEKTYSNERPSSIIHRALKGASSDEIALSIQGMMRAIGTRMSNSVFKHSQEFEGDYRSPDCKTCPLRVAIQDDIWCVDQSCFNRKQEASKTEYLEQASLICGIPVNASLEYNWQAHRFYSDEGRQISTIGCENLRLSWTNSERKVVDGYPHAEIVCQKSSAHCTCKRALESGVLKVPEAAIVENTAPETGKTLVEAFGYEVTETETDPDAHPLPEIEPAQPKKLTAEDLKEIDREMRRQKRQELEECKAIRDEATRKVYFALIEHNPAVWREVTKDFISFQKRDSVKEAPFEELMLLIAEKIAVDLYDWQYNNNPSSKIAVARYNELFKQAGLPEIVSVETEKA